MLCTFTIYPKTGTPEDRVLVIRSEDIRKIADGESGGTWVHWVMGTETHFERIVGTARENMDRLLKEEIDAITRVQAQQQRVQDRTAQGLPVLPIPRGRPR